MQNDRRVSTILVSTCLVGVNTRYDGEHNRIEDIVELVKAGKAVFLCPEQVGGLTTPREPSEIEPGKTAADVLAGEARVLSISGGMSPSSFCVGHKRRWPFAKR